MIIETFGNFYTCDPVSLGQAEKLAQEFLIENIKNTSTYQSNLVVNLTWFWHNDESFVNNFFNWINQHSVANSTKLYFTSFIDGPAWFRDSEFYLKVCELGHDISFHGYGEDWYSIFPGWLKKYETSELILSTFPSYVFLSYNRKPADHRVELVKKLISKNLHRCGWITFQSNYFPEIDKMTQNSDRELFPNQDMVEYYQPNNPLFSRPEDIRSLGNMNIWNNSYCIIVSETDISDKWHISEKIWKPILGLRPYLLNTNPNIPNILHDLGFYTPGDLFDDSSLDSCQLEKTVEFVESLSNRKPKHLYNLWRSQQKMLIHNRHRFQELAKIWNFVN